jgi:hypothetical protein
MLRITPDKSLKDLPCSIVAVSCAVKEPKGYPELRKDGYATLDAANKYIRINLPIKNRIDYKRGHRPKLKDMKFEGRAIVCVYGHFIYVDKDQYWSFFDNDEDEVVNVWNIKS